MQDERTRLISPCLKAGVLRRDLINPLWLQGYDVPMEGSSPSIPTKRGLAEENLQGLFSCCKTAL